VLSNKILTKYQPIVLALAGVFQTSYLVNQLAMTGTCDEAAFNASINSIYKINAANVAAVFGGKANLKLGLRQIELIFGHNEIKPSPHISRYALSLILVQHKVSANRTMMEELRKRIEQVIKQAEYFSPTHSTVINNLADIYTTTVSKFRFRINIVGKAENLRTESQINKMRALFLAGIRAAVLWRQVGGRRWQLFFSRPTLLLVVREILKEIERTAI
jgi:high frequency lysogenization protein